MPYLESDEPLRIPRNSSSGSRVKAAAKREMKGDAIGELSIPQLDDDCLGRELIRLKLKDGPKREGASPIPDGRNRTASTRFARA